MLVSVFAPVALKVAVIGQDSYSGSFLAACRVLLGFGQANVAHLLVIASLTSGKGGRGGRRKTRKRRKKRKKRRKRGRRRGGGITRGGRRGAGRWRGDS